MQCRLALALHCAPSEVTDLPTDDYDLLLRYWQEEPWGAWRDNVHAAIIARQLVRLQNPRAQVSLDDFMLIDPEKRRAANVDGLVAFFRAAAGGTPKQQATKRPPSGRAKRKR